MLIIDTTRYVFFSLSWIFGKWKKVPKNDVKLKFSCCFTIISLSVFREGILLIGWNIFYLFNSSGSCFIHSISFEKHPCILFHPPHINQCVHSTSLLLDSSEWTWFFFLLFHLCSHNASAIFFIWFFFSFFFHSRALQPGLLYSLIKFHHFLAISWNPFALMDECHHFYFGHLINKDRIQWQIHNTLQLFFH